MTKREHTNQYARNRGKDTRLRDKLAKPWYRSIARIRHECKKNGTICELTYAWAKETYTGECALSGLPFKRCADKVVDIDSVSIDRIDPDLGYIPTNCRFILQGLNALKGKRTDQDVIKICKAMVARHG